MSVGARVQARMIELEMSAAEVAQLAGITPATVRGLIRGRNRSSTHLHRIAQALQTTAGYLEGEVDDASLLAPGPPSKSVVQHVDLPVALPAQHVLAAAFRSLISAAGSPSEDDLAQSLARGLPAILQIPHHALWDAPRSSGGQ